MLVVVGLTLTAPALAQALGRVGGWGRLACDWRCTTWGGTALADGDLVVPGVAQVHEPTTELIARHNLPDRRAAGGGRWAWTSSATGGFRGR